jgi:hypothetical protein
VGGRRLTAWAMARPGSLVGCQGRQTCSWYVHFLKACRLVDERLDGLLWILHSMEERHFGRWLLSDCR